MATLTPHEVRMFARTRSTMPGGVYPIGLIVAYWRLEFQRPKLDVDDACAILSAIHKRNPPRGDPAPSDDDA